MDSLPPIVEHVPAVIFRISRGQGSRRTWFVTQNISIYGYTADEFLSGTRHWEDIVHPDDRAPVSRTIADFEAHGISSFKLYYRLLTKSGESVAVTEHNTANPGEDGGVLCYDTVIISNAQMEDSRRLIDDHSRQQVVLNDILMSLHDSTPEHALRIILDRAGAYLDLSRVLLFRDSPDHTAAELVREWRNRDIASVAALRGNTYGPGVAEIYAALQVTGYLLLSRGDVPENCREKFEAEGLVASAIFAVSLNGSHYGFVCFDDCVAERRWDEDAVRFLKNVSDLISAALARQLTARQLAQNQSTYEAVLNNINSYIFVTDRESDRIIFANRAFKASFSQDCEGKSPQECMGCSTVPELHPDDPEHSEFEVFCERSGEWLSGSFEELTWIDGRRVRLVNCYDITAKKMLADTLEEKIADRTRELLLVSREAELAKERAEEAALAKSRFLANMSHEMRTPMNAIIGMTNIYKSTTDFDRKDYCVEKIGEASAHLLGVVNDILDMSKIEAGKLELSPAEFSFEKMLMQVSNVLSYSVNQKQQEFSVSIDSNIPSFLVSDEQRISQVITNMLSNAVKFTPVSGSIALSARMRSETDGVCLIEVSVRDTGIGIAKSQQKKLFRSFEQADAGISRHFGGTGLGLAISKNIAGMLDGDIVVDSAPGKGSTFTFTFRAQRGAEESPSRTPDIDWSELRILVVDDAPDVRDYFMSMADSYHFRCETAADSEEAREKLEAADAPYHIVFADWKLPGTSGVELTRRIKRSSDSAVIMISAFEWGEIEQEAREAGVDHFIPKPLFPSAIVDCIHRCAAGKSGARKGAGARKGTRASFEGRCILLAEDVEINREIVISLLEPTGIAVDCAANGAEAVELFRSRPERYDAILMDVHMPEVDGYEATRRIRALQTARAGSIPIIAMTANVFHEDIQKCLDSGMNDHLGKPLDIDNVIAKLSLYLK